VIAYDRRGFGRSGGLPLARRMSDHVADAARLLRELDAAPATVVGWSAGGIVAAGLAIEHPDLVSSLVLSEGALHLPLNPTRNSIAAGARIAYAHWVRRDPHRVAREVFDWTLAYRTGGTQFERFPPDWQESMLASGTGVAAESKQVQVPYPSRAALRSIRCPITLLQGGLSDPVFERVNGYLRRLMPAARLVEVDGTAHCVHFDRPEPFREAVVAAAG
jgi:pimeloyl-ACP methyl ester carboxylesterase